MTGNVTVLLTGATGLVGRFLLAGLMRRRIPTAVLVRSQPHRSAMTRIEESLQPFEADGVLPRPIVIEGDLNRPGLGLSDASRQFLADQKLCILHSAASIRFNAETAESEPYATNVAGTGNLLDVAQQWSVAQFHHVSTAYVQCDRQQRQTAYEVAVTSDAHAGNDYERSKIISEGLIRNCGHIGIKTFYRPSIVVGDSVTGYTSTYHGFYAPLQLAATLIRALGLPSGVGDQFREHLGLLPDDSKNIVPVDWLAAAILQLMENSAAHGGIYHLTHPRPSRLSDMQAAILDAIDETLSEKQGRAVGQPRRPTPEVTTYNDLPTSSLAYGDSTQDRASWMIDGGASQLAAFRQQLTVYESYFLNDPPFDRTQTESFLKDLPCPAMDYAALKRLALHALASNFGWPRPRFPQELPQHLQMQASSKGELTGTRRALEDVQLVLEILGPSVVRLPENHAPIFCRQSGQWRTIPVLSSSANGHAMRLVTTEQSLKMAVAGEVDAQALVAQGRWIVRSGSCGDWLAILHDWVEHLIISDVEKPA